MSFESKSLGWSFQPEQSIIDYFTRTREDGDSIVKKNNEGSLNARYTSSTHQHSRPKVCWNIFDKAHPLNSSRESSKAEEVSASFCKKLYASSESKKSEALAGQSTNRKTYKNLSHLDSYHHSLIEAAKEKDENKANTIFSQIAEKKLQPNVYTYKLYLNILVKLKRKKRVETVLDEMQSAGIQPDEEIYNILLKFYAQLLDRKEAESIFRKMTNLNVDQYNTLLNLYVKLHDINKTEEILAEMQLAKLQPDRITYSLRMKLYNKLNLKEKTEAVLEEMKQSNVSPNKFICFHLIDFLIQQNQLKEACLLFETYVFFPEKKTLADLYPLTQVEQRKLLDCQDLSFGSACALIHIYLESKQSKLDYSPFYIITSIEHHSKNEKYEMKKRVQEFIEKFHPVFICQETDNQAILVWNENLSNQ